MGGACEDAEGEAAQWTIVGDAVGMAAQEQGGTTHEIFQSTRGLQSGRGSDDGYDDEHHVNRGFARGKTKAIDENESAEHAIDTQSDAAHTRTDEDKHEDDKQFYQDESCCHLEYDIRLKS